jgi:hypothetical protein
LETTRENVLAKFRYHVHYRIGVLPVGADVDGVEIELE